MLPLRLYMDQHHVTGADVLARELRDVDVMGDQNEGVVAFGRQGLGEELLQCDGLQCGEVWFVIERCQAGLHGDPSEFEQAGGLRAAAPHAAQDRRLLYPSMLSQFI